MNAHADMLFVAKHNEKYIPRGIYRFLISGMWNFAGFLFAKTRANKRLLLCLRPFAADVQTSPAQVHGAKVLQNLRMCKKIAIFFAIFSLEDARGASYSLEWEVKNTRIWFGINKQSQEIFLGNESTFLG